MKPETKIISGGQTGVDRAALDFAIKNSIRCGGWCPKGRKAEDGIIPLHYPLKETASEDYESRTIMNVKRSDGTLIIFNKNPDNGTLLTIKTAEELGKEIFIQDVSKDHQKRDFQKWLKDNNIEILNIAGPREKNETGIYEQSMTVLGVLFEKI